VKPLLKESVALGQAVVYVKYVNIHNIFLLCTYFFAASYSECKVSTAYATNIV
jgi:hypothetical protein